MTIENTSAGVRFCCDVCFATREPGRLGRGSERRDFKEEWEDAKREGWRAVKRGEEWQHLCEGCRYQ